MNLIIFSRVIFCFLMLGAGNVLTLPTDVYLSGFKQAEEKAQAGDVAGMLDLAYFYYRGTVVEKDDKKVFEIALKAAQAGSVHGQRLASTCYSQGIGTERSFEDAVLWAEKAANQGSVDAQYDLYCFFVGAPEGEKDPKKALYWLEKAVAAGYDVALDELACLYAKGRCGLDQDDKKAFELVLQAAEKGLDCAQVRVAESLFRGFGTDKNCIKAFEWLLKAADQENMKALELCGRFYHQGIDEDGLVIVRDGKKALDYYARAIERGSVEAITLSANIYLYGKEVPVDVVKGLSLVFQAAEKNDTYALWSLGVFFWDGEFLAKDVEAGRAYFEKAIALGDEFAKKLLEDRLQVQKEV